MCLFWGDFPMLDMYTVRDNQTWRRQIHDWFDDEFPA